MWKTLQENYDSSFNFLSLRYWIGELDTRPLSLFRILYALCILKVAFYYVFIAETFFSDEGILPRQLIFEIGRSTRFSLLDALGKPWQAQLFFLLWMLIAFNLLIGYQTRWMTILNWIFIVSVHERATIILNGADVAMRVFAFWIMFIPLGHYYSVDAVRRRWRHYQQTHNLTDLRVEEAPHTALALPIRFLQLQIAIIYVFTFLLKVPGEPWKNGSALHYALQVKSLMLPTGDWFLEHVPYQVLQFGTYFTLIFEATFIFFVFLPFMQPALRQFSLLMGAMMHLGIAVLMAIPNFSYIMLASYLTFFLPEWFTAQLRAKGTPLQLPLPNAHSPLWLLLAVTRRDEIATTEHEQPATGWDEWVIMGAEGTVYQGWEAWRAAGAHLPLSRVWLPVLKIPWVRRFIWSLATLPFGVPTPATYAERTPYPQFTTLMWTGRAITSIILIWFMVGVVWWNLPSVKLDGETPLVKGLRGFPRQVMQYTGVWQGWGMFSPYPNMRDGWVSVHAEFEDGTTLDLITEKPINNQWTRWYWGADRWKKFGSNMFRGRNRQILMSWGDYYCHLYNDKRALPEGERLARFRIIFNYQPSYAPGETPNEIEARVLWRHWCYSKYKF